jgi:hypothetical protein
MDLIQSMDKIIQSNEDLLLIHEHLALHTWIDIARALNCAVHIGIAKHAGDLNICELLW